MKSLLLATVLSLALAQPMFQCAPETLQWKNDLGCIKLDPSSTDTKLLYDIRLCSDFVNTYCPATNLPTTQGVEVLCTTPPSKEIEVKDAANTLPGDPCTTDIQCLSGTCTMGYCVGAAVGTACDEDSDCNPGNFCDATTNECSALLTQGEGCDRDEMCQMNMGCNLGLCTPYFSVADTAESNTVSDCGNNDYPNFPLSGSAGIQFSVFCMSGVCNTKDNTCSSALKSNTDLPVSCTTGQAGCPTSSTTGVTGSTECVLGKNPNGDFYCAAEIGDQPYQNFMAWFTGTYIQLASGHSDVCHTLHRHLEPVCLNMLGGTYLLNQWTIYYNSARNYAVYATSDLCTKQVIEPEVFKPTQANLFCDTSFSCAANLTFASAQGCIQQSTAAKTFAVRPCTDYLNSFCPNVHYYHQLDSEVQCYQPTSAPAAAVADGYPGDLCGVNSQCLSNICTQGKCAGVIAASLCKKDADCEVGLYCDTGNTGKCQALIGLGETCTSSQQCVMNAGCNFANGPTGTCVAYYSVGVSTTNFVSDCGVGTFLPGGSSILQGNGYMVSYSAFCASGTCEITGPGANTGYCVNSYAQTSPIPTTCNFLKTDCVSSNGPGAGSTYNLCACGRASGSRYCTLDLGDQPFVDLMQWSQTYIGNTTNCHTLRRGLDPVCMQNNDMGGMYTVMQFNERYYMATHYPIIVDASNCTQQVYMPQYWAAKQYNTYYSSNQNPPQPNFALYGFVASALVLVLS